VEAKRKSFAAWASDPKRWAIKVSCDLYIAAFLLPKKEGAPANADNAMVPTTANIRKRLGGESLYGPMEAAAIEEAEHAYAFHWPLAFPEVLIGKGGFDVVIGNPPWEVVQLGEEEYFASREPAVSLLKGAARKRAIAALEIERPEIFDQFKTDKRVFDAMNEFARASGRFNLTARGKVNTYGLFAELFLNLSAPTGRSGLIVPTGISTDSTTSAFFGYLIEHKRLQSVLSLENEELIFPGVHHSFRFCLLTMADSKKTDPVFVFFARQVGDLADEDRRFRLSAEQISQINPLTKTAPIFRSKSDSELAAKIYSRVQVWCKHHDRPVLVQNFFSASNKFDANLFEAARGMALDQKVPVLRGTMIEQFDNRVASFDTRSDLFRDVTNDERMDLNFIPVSDKWVPEKDLLERLEARAWRKEWLVGWRDITSAHVNRTVIASALPLVATDDTLSLILIAEESALRAAAS